MIHSWNKSNRTKQNVSHWVLHQKYKKIINIVRYINNWFIVLIVDLICRLWSSKKIFWKEKNRQFSSKWITYKALYWWQLTIRLITLNYNHYHIYSNGNIHLHSMNIFVGIFSYVLYTILIGSIFIDWCFNTSTSLGLIQTHKLIN